MIKKLLKSKTMLFATALSLLGVVQANLGVMTQYLSPEAAGWATMGVGIAVALLRAVTTTAITEK